jgi:hypothetical protein
MSIRRWEVHIKHVKKIFELLKKEKLYIKLSKCEFGKNSPIYLVYIVDVGASPASSEHGTNTNAFVHMMNCLKCFEVGYAKRK